MVCIRVIDGAAARTGSEVMLIRLFCAARKAGHRLDQPLRPSTHH